MSSTNPVPHRVVLVVPPEPQLLDVVGPAEVFDVARRLGGPDYRVEVVGLGVGPVASAGISLAVERSLADVRGRIDTLLIAGGAGARRYAGDPAVTAMIGRAAAGSGRIASVCTGAFLLAAAGLLEGRRVTTHWAWCDDLAARHPGLVVDPEPIFVHDGQVWTSAGVTAGMDLALALVAADHDEALAHEVARWLVLFTRRPGGQAQFSTHLAVPPPATPALAATLAWAADHLDADLSVAALAARSAQSPRTFARRFAAELGRTPAAWVVRARVEAAQRALQQGDDTLPVVAARCGFGSVDALHRAFRSPAGTTPATYRQHFRATDPAA